MGNQERISFADVLAGTAPPDSSGLVVSIRTDARHAVGGLRRKIVEHLMQNPAEGFGLVANEVVTKDALDVVTRAMLHQAYQGWGRSVLTIFSDCLDYAQYGLHDRRHQRLDVHFYNADSLAHDALDKAVGFVQQKHGVGTPVLFVSLDDMIEARSGENWDAVGFSRLFSLDGKSQLDFVARPGKPTIEQQIRSVGQQVDRLFSQQQKPVAIVLVEDNVRHAKTLNWVLGKMADAGVMQNSFPACIATCFSMASPQEQAAIRFGETGVVPVLPSVDYGQAAVDVLTPRDLLFDGFVVQVGEKMGRLPGVFIDAEAIASRFKIRPAKAAEFLLRTKQANQTFCRQIETSLGFTAPVAWFAGCDPITHVTGVRPEDSMSDLMLTPLRRSPISLPVHPVLSGVSLAPVCS